MKFEETYRKHGAKLFLVGNGMLALSVICLIPVTIVLAFVMAVTGQGGSPCIKESSTGAQYLLEYALWILCCVGTVGFIIGLFGFPAQVWENERKKT